MNPTKRLLRWRRHWHAPLKRLRHDISGVAILEFALAMPLVLVVGLYGIETANLALINLRVSQIALNLADNAARVGATSALNTQQLREVDVNDVLQGARFTGSSINLTTNGRITLSSLENQSGTQYIHWQRCIGQRGGPNDPGYDSSYGTTSPTDGTLPDANHAGTLAPTGMGDPDSQVNAPLNSGVMFVEINYHYQPLISTWLMQPARIHYVASFIVRDDRDFSQIFNPSKPATPSTCNLHPA